MKQIFQIIVSYFPGFDVVQFVLIIVAAPMLIKAIVDKISSKERLCEAGKKNEETEGDVWAIE